MSNFIISNKQGSNVSLAPLHDTRGHMLVLRPRGKPGDSKEIDADTAHGEIVERVVKAGWVSIAPVGLTPAATPPVPPAPPVHVEPPARPTPKPEPEAPEHVAPEHSEPVHAESEPVVQK